MNTWRFKSLVSNSLSGSVQPICYRVRDQHTHTHTHFCAHLHPYVWSLHLVRSQSLHSSKASHTHKTHAHMLVYPPTMWPPASLSLISSLKSISAHWSAASAWINKTCCLVLLLTHTHTAKKKLKWLILHPENILENFALKICFGKNFYVPIW